VTALLLCAAGVAWVLAIGVLAQDPNAGWSIPATGAAEKNPLAANDATIAAGKRLYNDRCAKCHGLRGKGDGPDGDESLQDKMDLTVAARAARNSDGQVFYKIWNGRQSVRMPAQSKELTKEQVWSIVAFVQTLRARSQNLP
jgi:mono/diheme cytochrome c family protein